MKPQAKTLQERFGFADPELTTPAHDALMMWLDGTIEEEFAGLDIRRKEWLWEGFSSSSRLESIEAKMKNNEFVLPPMPPARFLTKTWEYAITGERNYILGFADMMVTCEYPYLDFRTTEEFSIKWRDRDSGGHPFRCFFEVKPKINSLGELIRQVRMYQTVTAGRWFVVSPDDRFAPMLKSQGIGFVKAPSSLP